jgi:hypothetical protein
MERSFRAGREVVCPRCSVVMDRRRVPPRSDVSYVRDRVWLTCPSCRNTLVLDRRRP